MKLSCKCGNETEWAEETIVEFTVDSEGSRLEKVIEDTEYFCDSCGKHAEICGD